MNPPTVIEPHVYENDPSSPGRRRLVRTKTVDEVLSEIRAAVGEYPEGGEEYLSAFPLTVGTWPEGRTVVFAVEGTSEGHYVHVEVHHGDSRVLVLLAKTFAGRDAAWRFARQLADLLAV